MYGGAAVEPNMNQPHQHQHHGSPIPQQWWDQEGQRQQGQGPPPGTPNGSQRYASPRGMSAMDAAAANDNPNSYRSASPSMDQRMNGMNMNMNNGNSNQVPSYGAYAPTPPHGQTNAPPPPQPQARGPAANGLIRLTLRNPWESFLNPWKTRTIPLDSVE